MTSTTTTQGAPVQVEKRRLHYPNIFWIAFAHLMVIVAIPFFTWDAFAWSLILLFGLAPLGINLGYHRMVTHGGLKMPKWAEAFFLTLGAAIGGGPPLHWVAEHRLHHRFSDTPKDPHDATKGFWFAHITHLFWHKEFEDVEEQWMAYIPDLAKNRYYYWLNKNWILLPVASLGLFYLWGGWTYVLWLGFVRVTLMLHITWFVNSATHMWGYRNYDTPDKTTNTWWVALLAAGEGWHNNHHAQQVSARHGHKWWEFDLTYLWVRFFELIGLAKDVKRPQLSLMRARTVSESSASPAS
ncbi:MAG: fatty acid desaturase [Bdellovibrionales bacterium]|nr:fatty acid desaturase [Bdellovibrionales bacterium]